MTTPSPPDGLPFLRAATAGLRHHIRTGADRPADRAHLDTLHAHLTALHQLLDRLAGTTRPPHPAAGRLLSTAHTHLWQASSAVHDAFHTLPTSTDSTSGAACDPKRLPKGPPFLTICHRHLATGHAVRRKTTPADHTRAS
ncbi:MULTISPECIES: DUF6238 family protein [Streptomyces]|uniref:Uncharacterized protein n=1 Tax=Streptomyces tsukubensis (strain DSM 42081 / NBRC 108919 / NRRL 18488 / 9993) TaxID=1114943 RepID=I2N7W4_STRT9|nr:MULTISPECIES: DUF6238 family protein [Streptomyces]AZK97051.1 hypothetical protein B7R87_26655 [Streptomyces tsukubensis]EIF93111.1 hypothetical protein [Streptomyces tsukubensis NRRL18488]MYS66508.1 hypothetical protein [Streptomyces sp. SID5473]QKM66976.1 hypothetical protein STSU_007125 [Streptomyces tsukubensis NRRL18488]TAI41547.1 hypothetical protein EWI31_27325 [Streptomyces tsukubensis]